MAFSFIALFAVRLALINLGLIKTENYFIPLYVYDYLCLFR